jgi:hypothetical protein
MEPGSSSQGRKLAGNSQHSGANQPLNGVRGTVNSDFTASPSRDFRVQVKIRFIIRKSIAKCKNIRA